VERNIVKIVDFGSNPWTMVHDFKLFSKSALIIHQSIGLVELINNVA